MGWRWWWWRRRRLRRRRVGGWLGGWLVAAGGRAGGRGRGLYEEGLDQVPEDEVGEGLLHLRGRGDAARALQAPLQQRGSAHHRGAASPRPREQAAEALQARL